MEDIKPEVPNEPHKAVLGTAVGATVLIAIGAFVLSFAALTDLAERSGIQSNLAWIWPIIIDGMIVAATVAIVALNGFNRRAMIYPWSLLFFGAITSGYIYWCLQFLANATPERLRRRYAWLTNLVFVTTVGTALVALLLWNANVLLVGHAS